jgi:hypothetical protein
VPFWGILQVAAIVTVTGSLFFFCPVLAPRAEGGPGTSRRSHLQGGAQTAGFFELFDLRISDSEILWVSPRFLGLKPVLAFYFVLIIPDYLGRSKTKYKNAQ